ncbi:MAG: Zn-ribbon domain-containing OB-fold protein [Micromonosporaceae bacterium]
MDQVPPQPVPNALTAPYWEACRRGELAIQRCASCARFVHFPEPRCPYCAGTRLDYAPVSGDAVVHTFSVIHRAFTAWFAAQTPYVIAWVELAEQRGLRAFGNVVGCRPEDVSIGMPVRACFTELAGFGPVPQFEPVTAGWHGRQS